MARSSAGCPRCAELEIEVAEYRAAFEALKEEVKALRATVRDLQGRLGLNSRNSSKPPSSDPPWSGSGKGKSRRSGRKRGGQPGHEGRTRRRFTQEQIDRSVAVAVERCHHCDQKIDGPAHNGLDPLRHQVVEIPEVSALVTEYVLERRACPHCGVVTRAALPEGMGSGVVGPCLQAVATLLSGRYRLSRREVADALVELFGPKAEICASTVSTLEECSQEALEAACEEAGTAVRQAAVTHADETSFGRRWLWTACNALVSSFHIDKTRSRGAFESLLGGFKGVLVTDRYAAYDHHPPEKRQVCWAHLKRDFKRLVDRGRPAAPLGHAGLRACKEVFKAWRDHKEGNLACQSMARRMAPVREALRTSLKRHRSSPDRKARALARDLLKRYTSLWTFCRRDGVAPDNNLAEREIRPAVLWRKGSFGCQSRRGERFVAGMLTVTRTLRKQRRSVLGFLVDSICAHRSGADPPSLLHA